MVCVVADGCFHQVDNWCLFAGPLIITILTRAAAEAASVNKNAVSGSGGDVNVTSEDIFGISTVFCHCLPAQCRSQEH